MSPRRLWPSLLVALLVACSEGGGPAPTRTVEVTVTGLFDRVQALQVQLSIPAGPHTELTVSRRLDLFRLLLPEAFTGRATLYVAGLGPDGCVIADSGEVELLIGDQRLYTPSVALRPLEQPGCGLLITKVGGGPGRVRLEEPPGVTLDCGFERTACTVVLPLEQPARLTAHGAPGESFFTGWSGACTGNGPCEVTGRRDVIVLRAGFLHSRLCKDGFCWENPLPQGNNLHSVWASPLGAWAVGGAGTVLRWNGSFWAPVPVDTRQGLSGVYGFTDARSGTEDVFVVGNWGTVLHERGGAWRSLDTREVLHHPEEGYTDGLSGIWGTSPNDLWAVGNKGTVVHFDGARWGRETVPTEETLRGVWGSGPGDVWAVGDRGAVLHRSEERWRSVPSPRPLHYQAISGSGPDDVWMVGFDDQGGLVLHYSEGRLRVACEPGSATCDTQLLALRGVHAAGPRDVWVASSFGSTIWHYDGARWTRVAADTPTDVDFLAVFGHRAGELWAVGSGGAIVRWNGVSFTSQSPGLRDHLIAIGLAGPDRASPWAVSRYGQVLRRREEGWRLVHLGVSNIGAAFLRPDGTRPLVAGGPRGFVLESDGVQWLAKGKLPLDLHEALTGVWENGPGETWFCGPRGLLFLCPAGQPCRQVVSNTDADLNAISGIPPDLIFAVGERGTIIRCVGESCAPERAEGVPPELADAPLYAVWGARADSIWAAGQGGLWLVRTSQGWHWLGRLTTAPLRAIWGTAWNDLWIGGQSGTLYHYDGSVMQGVPIPLGNTIAAGVQLQDELLVAGVGGAILRRQR